MTLTTREQFVPWILVSVVLLVYLSFPTKNYFFDGIDFAQSIEDAHGLQASLLHPSHLIYSVTGYLIYKAVTASGAHLRALEVLQIMNAVLSAMCAFVLFHTLRSVLRSIFLCSALTLLFAFAATWWKFSTDANAYIPSVLFVLISFNFILPLRPPRPLFVALTFSLSMVFHQIAVVFLPVLVEGIFLQTASRSLKQRIMIVLRFCLAAFVITFSAYYCGYYLATGTFGFMGFTRWVTYHSPDTSFSFKLWSNLVFTLRGQARLFLGGRFNLIKGLINPFISGLLVILAALFLSFVFSLVRFAKAGFRKKSAPGIDPRTKPLVLLCVLWLFVYNGFLFFWLPFHTFYRLFYLPALILLAGILLSTLFGAKVEQARSYRVASLVAIIALANFIFLIFPYSHAQKYPPEAFALEMKQRWPPGTVIFYAQSNSDNRLFRYLNPTTIWKRLDTPGAAELETELQGIYRRGNTAWIEWSAINQFSASREGTDWLSTHALKESLRELNDPAFRIKFIQIAPHS